MSCKCKDSGEVGCDDKGSTSINSVVKTGGCCGNRGSGGGCCKDEGSNDTVSLTVLNSEQQMELIKVLIQEHSIVLFIKGTPQNPACRFTRQLLHHLYDHHIVQFKTFDVLQPGGAIDETGKLPSHEYGWRAVIKQVSKWGTFPQVYVNQEIIGGVDKLKEYLSSNDSNHQDLKNENEAAVKKIDLCLQQKGCTLFVPETPTPESEQSIKVLQSTVNPNFWRKYEIGNTTPFKQYMMEALYDKEDGGEAGILPQLWVDGGCISGFPQVEMIGVSEGEMPPLDWLDNNYRIKN